MRRRPSPSERKLPRILAIGVYLMASSAPAAHRSVGPSSDEDIGQLWRDAQARIETSDYPGAIERLTRLYELLGSDPEAKALRLRVIWALHRAHVGAEAVDHDPSHLYVARDLLNKYRAELTDDEAEQREQADAAAAEVDARIAAIEANRPPPEPEPEPEPESEPPPPVAEPRPAAVPPSDDPRPDRALVISGGAFVGLGVVGLALVGGGFGSARAAIGRFERDPDGREAARDAIQRGNRIGIAGATLAGVGIVTGAVLLGVGLGRRRGSSRPSVAFARDGLTLAWTGRF